MKWKMLFLLFPVTAWSFCIIGKWSPINSPEVVIDVQEKTVIGLLDNDKSVQMDIQYLWEDRLQLDNVQLIQRPSDWYNVVKYRSFIKIFQKIKQYGLLCQIYFLNNNHLIVEPQIGKETFKLMLMRIEK